MSQTRRGSFVEACLNTIIGFGVSFLANILILPQFGCKNLTLADNFWIGVCFTVISILRSYVLRRWANRHLHRVASWLA